jgi:anti-anti-sigma regulatory factor
MMDSLQISVDNDKEVAVMYLRGRFGIENVAWSACPPLAMLRGQNPPETTAIDLAAVACMDTSGLATLIEGLKIARTGGPATNLSTTAVSG